MKSFFTNFMFNVMLKLVSSIIHIYLPCFDNHVLKTQKKKTNDCWLTCFKAIICFNSQCKYLAKSLHSNCDLDSEELKHTKVLTLGSPSLKFGYQPKKNCIPQDHLPKSQKDMHDWDRKKKLDLEKVLSKNTVNKRLIMSRNSWNKN